VSALRPCDFDWEEALDSAQASLRSHILDGWELELVRRRVKNILASAIETRSATDAKRRGPKGEGAVGAAETPKQDRP
jgi:SRSO17 transposase